jgi:hypothetical protein
VRHEPKIPATRTPALRAALLALAGLAALGAGACSSWQAPELREPPRESANRPEPATADERTAECARLSLDLRRNQIARQEAPDTTTSPIIAEASEAKADRNIDIIKARYTELNCGAPAGSTPPLPQNNLP